MIVSFHPEAEAELLETVDYYESCKKDLGIEFAVEVYSTIERILAHPKTWPVLDGDVRRAQTNIFPYGVPYTKGPQVACDLAIMHLHRDPDYWKRRVT